MKFSLQNKQDSAEGGLVIAAFVSAHGFGHATRVSAILNAIQSRVVISKIILVGRTPRWFWEKNLSLPTQLHFMDEVSDVGLVQKNPFEHDLNLTEKALRELLAKESKVTQKLSSQLGHSELDLVLSDISTLGISVGNDLNVPTVLIENFTWSWIYQEYKETNPYFEVVADHFCKIYQTVDLRIQCSPYCEKITGGQIVDPVFRAPHCSKEETKEKLGFLKDEEYYLLTTGGISQNYNLTPLLNLDVKFVVPTDSIEENRMQNIRFIPFNSDFFFPDLVNASAGVIGKAGYGTISEAWGMSKPFWGIYRNHFAESEILRKFASSHLIHHEIEQFHLNDLSWLPTHSYPQKEIQLENGADQAAQCILTFLESSLNSPLAGR